MPQPGHPLEGVWIHLYLRALRCDRGGEGLCTLDKSTFFWPARVLKRDQHDRVCVEWDEEPTAAGDSSSSSSSSSTTSTDAAGSGSGSGGSSPTAGAGVDGNKPLVTATNAEDLTWVEERHVCMRDMPAEAKDLKRGSRAVAVWIDGHAYACEVLGSAGRRQMAVQFEDGLQYDAPMADMRTFLDEPLCAQLGDDEPRALGCAARSARGDGRPKPFCILEA